MAPRWRLPAGEGYNTSISNLVELVVETAESSLARPIQFLKGVGPRRAELFERLGVRTVGDLLFHLPLRYEDRSSFRKIAELEVDQFATVRAEVRAAGAMPRGRGRSRVFEVAFADETGILRATWFHFSAKALTTRFPIGSKWLVSGKVTFNRFRGSKVITHPDTERDEPEEAAETLNTGRIVPVYPLTEGLPQKAVRKAAHAALEFVEQVEEIAPPGLNERYRLPNVADALRRVHWPPEGMDLSALTAFTSREQKKLIFDELLLSQVALALRRAGARKPEAGAALPVTPAQLDEIRSLFPFPLTGAQKRALDEIAADVSGDVPMNRLLQGDVGSGKTAVALAACMMAVKNGRQAAIMAPTEILAVQHFRNITRLLGLGGPRVELFTSSRRDKAAALHALKRGDVDIAVGTHALIQDGVEFLNLGLVVIDEQHRFGVAQRAELRRKGERAHTLIMTATPIPRTLAMTLYGDLDVSVLDEMPPGRSPVETKVYAPAQRAAALRIIREQVAQGRQAYVVYPLVEESEKLELKAATEMFEHLRAADLAGLRLALTHGRMKSADKDAVMERFGRGEVDVLVATTVIEVGVDHPNATVMMIEHAERFGLSQLHQLRGRVGRGAARAHCLMMADTFPGSPAWKRLEVMTSTTDGFAIAEADLSMRGAGDLFGERQWGLPGFKIANLARDGRILAEARKVAFVIVEQDPALVRPEHAPLKRALAGRFAERLEYGEVG
ncbi:MAG: ATP-dependent DNA helicase RecG [Nitrospinae bacterium]|nr:ATP-dependent DNA helicase RecG [Nitrospinota bacterium]